MARVMVVEDDTALARALCLALDGLGHTTSSFPNGTAALAALASDAPDAMVLDVMMPGMDGFEVCRRVRADSELPIIMLTARTDPVDIVAGLEAGADDYVTKPVQPRVLDARIKAVLRRVQQAAQSAVLQIGDLRVDEAALECSLGGEPVSLTPTEWRLMLELVANLGMVLTRPVLLDRVWSYDYSGDSRIVDAAVQRLRAKIESDPANPQILLTVRGLGYRMVKP